MTKQVNKTKKVDQAYKELDKKLRSKGFFSIGAAAHKIKENPRVVRTWVEAFPTYVHAYWDDYARLWLQEGSMDPLRTIQEHLQKSHPTPTLRELKTLLTWEGKIANKEHPALGNGKSTTPAQPEVKPETLALQAVQQSVQTIQQSLETLHKRLENTEMHIVKLCGAVEDLNSNLAVRRPDERINKKIQKFLEEVRQWQMQIRTEIKDIQFKQHFTPTPSSTSPPRRHQRNKPKFLGIF